MKYEGTIEYMIKPTLGFGLQPNRQRASVTEMLFYDDDNGDRCGVPQDPSPFSSYVVVMVEIFVAAAMEVRSGRASSWWRGWMISSALAPPPLI
jgi:hypothetical protein